MSERIIGKIDRSNENVRITSVKIVTMFESKIAGNINLRSSVMTLAAILSFVRILL
jgi:hypothetical protein